MSIHPKILIDEDKIKIPEHGTLLTYENLALT